MRRRSIVAVAACLTIVGCGSTKATNAVIAHAPTTTPPTTAPPTTAPPTTAAADPPVVEPAPTAPAPDPGTPPVEAEAAPSPDRAPAPAQLAGAAGSQAIVVSAPAYGDTTATLTAYARSAGGLSVAFGPWLANVGVNGVAAPGQKTEGDGMTPSGTYAFDFAFGVNDDPGTRLPYRQITSPSIVWVEDSDSPLYNEWVDTATQEAPPDSETMYLTPVYDYGAVIAYNSERAPGAGSGIFLHVSHDGPTAGCVSVPESELIDLLRWIDPAQSPSIVIGVA